MDESIFRSYDIRGVYPRDINEGVVRQIGKACANLFPGGKVIVGRDVRIGSPELSKALIQGLLSNPRFEVVDIGVCTTPLFYFAVNISGAAGGVMVTASHNPSEWNGLKVVGKNAVMLGGKVIKDALKKVPENETGEKGQYKKEDFFSRYKDFYLRKFNILKPLSLVCDFGNGAAGSVFPEILKAFKNIKLYSMHEVPDGNFPGRSPNPLEPGALDGLKEEVKRRRADIGVAFDADGDRAFFVDSKGKDLPPQAIVYLLTGLGEKSLVVDISMFHTLKTMEYPGVFYESPVGTYFVKEKVRKEGADVGAEYSGHYYFKEFFNSDSGVFAVLKVLETMSALPSSEEFFEELPPCLVHHWNVQVKDPTEVIRGISKNYEGMEGVEKDEMDGVAFRGKDWFFGMRASNTEPLLRMYAGAKAPEKLESLIKASHAGS